MSSPTSFDLSISVSADAITALASFLPTINAGPSFTALMSPVAFDDTVINVADASAFAVGTAIVVETEPMVISAISTNALTVTRGNLGTGWTPTPVAHPQGARVNAIKYASIQAAMIDQINQFVSNAMTLMPPPAVTAQQAIIAAANIAITRARATAVIGSVQVR